MKILVKYQVVMVTACLLALCGCGTTKDAPRPWTVPDTKSWYINYKRTDPNAWDGILYQGSDSKYHHFIARISFMENWATISIKRADLKLAEVHGYSISSSAPMGYYFVDPSRDFVKMRNFQQYRN